jgi:hypothetical protein
MKDETLVRKNPDEKFKIEIILTRNEIELMRNCLSDLQSSGIGLNLKIANSLLDSGYTK